MHAGADAQRRGPVDGGVAVGTVAVAGLGGLLVKLLTSEWFFELLRRVIGKAFSIIFG